MVDLDLHLRFLILVALPSIADHYLWVALIDIQSLLLVADPGSYAYEILVIVCYVLPAQGVWIGA